ncbi:MAG: uroporphyrinogen decarboxylase family protein [Candidatus Methylomirabilota bacterium]
MTSRLSHRDRVLMVLNHEVPDRPPVDLGSSTASGINLMAYKRLKEYLGMPGPIRVQSERSLLAWPDEEVLARFDVDLRMVVAPPPEEAALQEIFEEAALAREATYTDMWGVTRRRPPHGHYYVTSAPFTRDDLGLADLDAHPWPAPKRPDRAGLRREAERLRRETDAALVVWVPIRFFSMGQFLCGFENWLVQLQANPEFCEELLERTLAIQMPGVEETLRAVGDLVDLLYFGDDYGMQSGPVISPTLFRRIFKPRMARLFEVVRQRSRAAIAMHSCGSIAALIPDFIDVGIQVLNPIQVAAAGMDTGRLKREYGRHLVFWGGIDTQQVLPRGTPGDVRAEVARRLADLSPAYLPMAVHNIQAEVPPENIVAMLDAIRGARLRA